MCKAQRTAPRARRAARARSAIRRRTRQQVVCGALRVAVRGSERLHHRRARKAEGLEPGQDRGIPGLHGRWLGARLLRLICGRGARGSRVRPRARRRELEPGAGGGSGSASSGSASSSSASSGRRLVLPHRRAGAVRWRGRARSARLPAVLQHPEDALLGSTVDADDLRAPGRVSGRQRARRALSLSGRRRGRRTISCRRWSVSRSEIALTRAAACHPCSTISRSSPARWLRSPPPGVATSIPGACGIAAAGVFGTEDSLAPAMLQATSSREKEVFDRNQRAAGEGRSGHVLGIGRKRTVRGVRRPGTPAVKQTHGQRCAVDTFDDTAGPAQVRQSYP